MAEFGFTEAQEMLLAAARDFSRRELMPGARERMKLNQFPKGHHFVQKVKLSPRPFHWSTNILTLHPKYSDRKFNYLHEKMKSCSAQMLPDNSSAMRLTLYIIAKFLAPSMNSTATFS